MKASDGLLMVEWWSCAGSRIQLWAVKVVSVGCHWDATKICAVLTMKLRFISLHSLVMLDYSHVHTVCLDLMVSFPVMVSGSASFLPVLFSSGEEHVDVRQRSAGSRNAPTSFKMQFSWRCYRFMHPSGVIRTLEEQDERHAVCLHSVFRLTWLIC